MRSLVFFHWLIFLYSKKQSLCVLANANQNSFEFFTSGTNLPGPTMSFENSLNKGIFEFEFKTFVDRALMLYQDDQGQSDYIRFVDFIVLISFSIST